MENIIIIGAGASGLTAAINVKNKNNNVIILERNSTCGKKILITGNGRCNYFNDDFVSSKYHSKTLDNFDNLININSKNMILNYFKTLGIIPKIKNNYYYPLSNQAISILNALILETKNRDINIINNVIVSDIKCNGKFNIITNNGNYECDKLIIACGGMACSKTGSDGSLYSVIESLGHEIVKIQPSLVQLKSNYRYLKELAGVRCDVIIKNNNHEEQGEMQFTNYGISGICAMQLSNYIVENLDKNQVDYIYINYLPQIEDVRKLIVEIDNNTSNRSIGNILDQLLNYKIVNVLLKECNISYDSKVSELNNKFDDLINILTNHKIEINGTNSFEEAQVTKGGVSMKEININTFESKIVNNLYFAGEVLDVNADCGGYNLGFAWLSGIIAGKSASNYDKD